MASSLANAPARRCLRMLVSEGSALQSVPRRSTPVALRVRQQPSARGFGSSAPLLKKRKIAIPTDSPKHRDAVASGVVPPQSSPSSPSSSKASQLSSEDPLDFSAVTSAYAPIDTHFKAQIAGMIHGGRFNPTNLGALSIAVKDPGADAAATFPLRELAQVVPRSGRTISLLVHDKDYIKPIMSAVQASREFNQQPQRSEDNDLELLLKVELERKDDVARRIKETMQAYRERIRQVRSRHEKTLKDWKKNGTVLPDLVKRAEKELQKVQDKKMKEIDQEEAQTIRQL
ncbi:hypothetical protein AK830_g5840 [Neonectria ditissima]|uniref:Ribosome recycling factor domain-containing protein n=1 Tax=Neonectria ditissima TaxID=78410 RepID=A0A0P7ASF1_9HYPO|nr:hypothetical protein AK830_g5840 [Neonectria ditissima]